MKIVQIFIVFVNFIYSTVDLTKDSQPTSDDDLPLVKFCGANFSVRGYN